MSKNTIIDEHDLLRLRVANQEYEKTLIIDKHIESELRYSLARIEYHELNRAILSEEKRKNSIVIQKAKNILDEIVTKIKEKYGLDDEDQIEWETGKVTKTYEPPREGKSGQS